MTDKTETEAPLPAITHEERESLPSIQANDLTGKGPYPWCPQLATWPGEVPKILRQPMTLAHLSQLLAALPEETRGTIAQQLSNTIKADWWSSEFVRRGFALAAAETERDALAERLEAALELIYEYECQWGDDYLATKWELKKRHEEIKQTIPRSGEEG